VQEEDQRRRDVKQRNEEQRRRDERERFEEDETPRNVQGNAWREQEEAWREQVERANASREQEQQALREQEQQALREQEQQKQRWEDRQRQAAATSTAATATATAAAATVSNTLCSAATHLNYKQDASRRGATAARSDADLLHDLQQERRRREEERQAQEQQRENEENDRQQRVVQENAWREQEQELAKRELAANAAREEQQKRRWEAQQRREAQARADAKYAMETEIASMEVKKVALLADLVRIQNAADDVVARATAEADKRRAAAGATKPAATKPAATATKPAAPAAPATTAPEPAPTAAATAPAAAIAPTAATETTTATETAATTKKKKKATVTMPARTSYPRSAAKLFKTPSKEQDPLLELDEAFDPTEELAKGRHGESLTRRDLQDFARDRAILKGTTFEAELAWIASLNMTAQSFVDSYHYDFVDNLEEQYDSADQFEFDN
jgi:hypothetical protein